MRQFTILSGKAMIVEMPEGSPTPDVINTGQSHLSWLDIDINLPDIDLPPGRWQIVGILSEVTTDDVTAITGQYYNKYNERYVHYPSASTRVTPIDDIESAIVAEGYYLDENPIPEPDISSYPNDDWIADYNNAQSRVLDRSRCLLLGRED